MKAKTLLLASDIAGLGKVAVTAALPLFAACQLEVAVLPTVILSSHTGGFSDVYIEDYQEGMQAFLRQWRNLEIDFSALVTGYLKSAQQIDMLLDFSREKKLPLIVDPIMGDRGKLYQGFDAAYVAAMRDLCQKAEIIIPNLTEACLLLDIAYTEKGWTESSVREVTVRLVVLGAKIVFLTGIPLSSQTVGLAYYQAEKDEFQLYQRQKIPQHFFGTGDILTALLASSYLQGLDFEKTIPLILSFLEQSLRTTLEKGLDIRLGVHYQAHLGEWIRKFQNLLEEKDEKQFI